MKEKPFAWTPEWLARLAAVQTYEEAVKLAIDTLVVMPKPICQVCGPISTGGLGSSEQNLRVLNYAIRFLQEHGMTVFDQQPYEDTIRRLQADDPAYLERFYLPIFKSGHITKFHFIPGWNTSVGTRWEHDQAVVLGIERGYFPESFIKLALLTR